MDSYEVLATSGSADSRTQRSRFFALAAPATDESAARAAIESMQQRYHDCRHVCHAWRLGSPDTGVREQRADAGEPAGTAGEPILAAIRQASVTDTVVVVARYFGGVKLGPGGLARAYGACAEAALAAATRRVVRLGRLFDLRFAYAQERTVRHLLQKHAGECREEHYGEEIAWTIWVPRATWPTFALELGEASAGSIDLLET